MAHVHSTVGVDSSRQLLKWQQIMGDVYYRVDIVGDRKHGIRGTLAEQALGRVSLTRFDSDRQRVLRTRAHIASDGEDSYVLVFPETGPLYFEHQGRNGYVQAGGYVMVRSSEYYELSCADNFRNTTIRIPAQALESEYPRAWTHCARAPRGPGEFAGVVRGFAQSAWRLNDASRQRLDRRWPPRWRGWWRSCCAARRKKATRPARRKAAGAGRTGCTGRSSAGSGAATQRRR